MTGLNLGVFVSLLALSSCKTTQNSEVRSMTDPLHEVSEVKPQPKAPKKDESPILLEVVYGRYSLELKNDEGVEVKNKKGKVHCRLSETGLLSLSSAKEVEEVKKALELLSTYEGHTSRNPMFVAYEESREILGFVKGKEFTIEMAYQAQEVLTPKKPEDKDAFDDALAKVYSIVRDEKFCPKKN